MSEEYPKLSNIEVCECQQLFSAQRRLGSDKTGKLVLVPALHRQGRSLEITPNEIQTRVNIRIRKELG